MPSSYELHRQSAREKEVAADNFEAARGFLDQAEANRAKAAKLYEEIIERAKNEVTPELIMEAYQEYKGFLKRKLYKAIEADQFGEAAALTGKLEGLAKEYKEDDRLMSEDIRQGIENLFRRKRIGSLEQEHLLNRGRVLCARGLPRENVIRAIENEAAAAPHSIAKAPFSGWEKQRSGHA